MNKQQATEVGQLADSVPGSDLRTTATVSGRLLEEAVELCLAAGLTSQEIMGHVVDSLQNQYLKLAVKVERTVFISERTVAAQFGSVADEVADLQLMLADLCHVANVDPAVEYDRKFQVYRSAIQRGEFYANRRGLLYRRKPHVKLA